MIFEHETLDVHEMRKDLDLYESLRDHAYKLTSEILNLFNQEYFELNRTEFAEMVVMNHAKVYIALFDSYHKVIIRHIDYLQEEVLKGQKRVKNESKNAEK